MSSAAAPRVGVATGIEDVDAATLSEVFARLDPASILSASASSKHLASAADEPLWREMFAKSWDEPVWEVSSYRELYLARHRAVLLLRSLPDAAPPPDDDPDAWLAVADACDVVASAVNASLRVERTDATLDDATIYPTLARLLRVHPDPRGAGAIPPPPRVPPRDVAFLAACRAYGACVLRCRRHRARLLAENPPAEARAVFRAAYVPDDTLGGWRLGREGPESESSRAAADAADLAPRRDDDDALAVALGGGSGPAAAPAWPPATPHRPRIEHALALATAPLALLGDADRARLPSHPFLAPAPRTTGEDVERVAETAPALASIPARGPWPRGGRPPHGQRARMERNPERSTVASVSGAWFGCRLDVDFEPGAAGEARASAPSVFRLNVTATPEGKLSGWMADTVGNLTVRGHVDPEGAGAFVVEAAFVDCGGLPGGVFAAPSHGRARMRLSGWFSATAGAGEWTQWSRGVVTRGTFAMCPNDDGRELRKGVEVLR